MKKKILVFVSLLALMALSIAAYAYTRTSNGSAVTASSCCCCKGDSCPMKKKDAPSADSAKNAEVKNDTSAAASCCDSCEHCKGGSCPMHKSEGAKAGDHTAGHAAGEGCCACCKDKKG